MSSLPVHVHALSTAVPTPVYPVGWASELMQEHVEGRPATRRLIRSLYRNSGIDQRHSVVDDWGQGEAAGEPARDPLFFGPDGTKLPTPGTAARNAVYTRESVLLLERVGRDLLASVPGVTAADITHVITISCTGFFAPGPDLHLVRALGLSPSTERYHVGFMGCYAAFQGLRMARAFCRADPDAVVLVLSVELCTLHLQFTDDPDDLIAGALFADGAAGALVSARPPRPDSRTLELFSFHADLAPEGAADMAWTVGDQGFRMRLSTYIPDIIEANLERLLGQVLGLEGLGAGDVPWWAVHPGGRAILDRVEAAAGLEGSQLAASRAVLRRYGNMSSATLLFVLKALLDVPDRGEGHEGGDSRERSSPAPRDQDRVLAMAFGPGLSLETGLFRIHAPRGSARLPGGANLHPDALPASARAADTPATLVPGE